MAEKKLTKREQKALAFKKKNKKKDQQEITEEQAFPTNDVTEDVPKVEEAPKSVTGKRKAESEEQADGTIEAPRKKKNRRPKKKKPEDGESHNRFIIFVGNLGYDTTKEELTEHFQQVGGIKSVRLLSDKVTKKPKGFAFVEFETARHLTKALAFHHTYFKKRQINVELTAGGGGNKSDARREKLKLKNEKLQQERQENS
ncbi:uncharacterized protein BYT42DRAFT_575249 [Radiomyces spectabilis]|uniref:uncharacterized protein n=1 Tax=Radiomyces spectabilis TaxID=64574 RepID=UPI00221E7FF9|nr:uncharacterized protein BYT42DRAFT_575249 [Radiomyces spectabilis]KAI8374132.1 hypothetical protein BYT42DRAFT_575249 [Radiomyces spectabilis]